MHILILGLLGGQNELVKVQHLGQFVQGDVSINHSTLLSLTLLLLLSLGWEDPLQEGKATHYNMPGEFHGQRNLVGYSSCGHKESDKTEQLTLTFF